MYESDHAGLYAPGNAKPVAIPDQWGADRTVPRFLTAVTAIAWYNALILLGLIFCVFKRYSGLYFWSLLVTSASVIPYATGEWMRDTTLFPNILVSEILLSVGFVFMVPGHSLVLYSRLHLVTENFVLLRFILCTIILTAVVLCAPTVTLNFHQHLSHPGDAYTHAYIVMDRIEMCIFTAQEIFISCVYLWEVHKALKLILSAKARRSMWQLVAMNVLHLILDTALLTVGFLDFYTIQWTFKGCAYSIKLLIEFGILTQLVRIVQRKKCPENFATIANKSPTHTLVQSTSSPQIRVQPVVQGNIPREWRVSVGISEIVSPSIRQRESEQLQTPVNTCSVDMYPGRLC